MKVIEGFLSPGLPYLRLGSGPPLVMATGLTPDHSHPTGMMRRALVSGAAPFAEDFTVFVVNRKRGLDHGATMSDIAADYASAIENDIGEPIHLHGTSTGGAVAQQLAIDHPHLVSRLVVAASACRLSPRGRWIQAEIGRLASAGDARHAWMPLTDALSPAALRHPMRMAVWLAGSFMAPVDFSDMLRTIAAEDVFDAESFLDRVSAPTLVLGGTADPFYSESLFRLTAVAVPDGRVVIFRGKGHLHAASSKESTSIARGFLLAS